MLTRRRSAGPALPAGVLLSPAIPAPPANDNRRSALRPVAFAAGALLVAAALAWAALLGAT